LESIKELQEKLSESEKQATELRKQIEDIKEANKPKPITDQISDYSDILRILEADESKDIIKIDKFDEDETKVVLEIIKKMRIVKVYNEGWLPKRGERRHYAYYDVSSGFVFDYTFFGDSCADTTSASRLCLKNEALTRDFVKKFKDVDERIIDIK